MLFLYPVEKEEAWNGDSGIFLFESIKGWSKKQDKTSKQTSDHQANQSIRSKQNHRYKIYTTRRVWRHTFTKSDRRWKGLLTDVHECWPLLREKQARRLSTCLSKPLTEQRCSHRLIERSNHGTIERKISNRSRIWSAAGWCPAAINWFVNHFQSLLKQ